MRRVWGKIGKPAGIGVIRSRIGAWAWVGLVAVGLSSIFAGSLDNALAGPDEAGTKAVDDALAKGPGHEFVSDDILAGIRGKGAGDASIGVVIETAGVVLWDEYQRTGVGAGPSNSVGRGNVQMDSLTVRRQ